MRQLSHKANVIKSPVAKGFSLVELLIVIAVMGVISSIAIASVSGIFQKSKDATVNQNVQNLATVFNGSRAAGAVYAVYTKDSIIDELTGPTGVRGSGSMSTIVFRLPMTAEAIAAAKSSTSLDVGGAGQDLRFVYTGP
jgi:prepilin-type N-terminal cleavage/methylation domain-containing protein